MSPGFRFTAFYEQLGLMATTKHYIGPQIYDDYGEFVWSSIDLFYNADSFDFRQWGGASAQSSLCQLKWCDRSRLLELYRYGNNTMLVAPMPRKIRTQLFYDGLASYVVVEALDGRGQLLPRGRTFRHQDATYQTQRARRGLRKGQDRGDRWLQGVALDKDHSWQSQIHHDESLDDDRRRHLRQNRRRRRRLARTPHRALHGGNNSRTLDDSNEMEKPTFAYESVGNSNASSSSLRETSLESPRKG